MRNFIYLLGFILILSCHFNHKKKNIQIIPEDKFVKLLVDYHLTEGVQASSYFREHSKNIAQINLCDTLLRNNRVTRTIFDSTVSYYSADPERYELIYEKVITELNKKIAKLEDKPKKKETKQTKKLK